MKPRYPPVMLGIATALLVSCGATGETTPTPPQQDVITEYTRTEYGEFPTGESAGLILKLRQVDNDTSGESVTTATIVNDTNLDYCPTRSWMQFSLNLTSWDREVSHPRIPAGGSYDVGVVSNNPARIDLGNLNYLVRPPAPC